MDKLKRIEILEQKANAASVSFAEACRRANVPERTISNWKNEDPKSFRIHDAIESEIEKLAAEKTAV